MSSRIEKIEVSAETAQLIRASAAARGVTVDDYLRSIAGAIAPESHVGMSFTEIDEVLDELAMGGEKLSPLPENFSREDIYDSHD